MSEKKKESTSETFDKLICKKFCWCGHHKCLEDDAKNSFLGINKTYLEENHKEKYKFKCEACSYTAEEMEDVKEHFISRHYENHMYKCWECNEEVKTIALLKAHLNAMHSKKDKLQDDETSDDENESSDDDNEM